MEFERRASLNWDQFDVIVGLLDEALRYEGMSYNTVIAPFVLELATRISTVSSVFVYFINEKLFCLKFVVGTQEFGFDLLRSDLLLLNPFNQSFPFIELRLSKFKLIVRSVMSALQVSGTKC